MDSRIRVLYAEDNRNDVDLTTSFFAQHVPDISLEIVRTARECLGRLQVCHVDALLLDHRLPDMDGAEVLKELANRKLAVPVVMVTGTGDEELVVRLLRLGAIDYVPKPRCPANHDRPAPKAPADGTPNRAAAPPRVVCGKE